MVCPGSLHETWDTCARRFVEDHRLTLPRSFDCSAMNGWSAYRLCVHNQSTWPLHLFQKQKDFHQHMNWHVFPFWKQPTKINLKWLRLRPKSLVFPNPNLRSPPDLWMYDVGWTLVLSPIKSHCWLKASKQRQDLRIDVKRIYTWMCLKIRQKFCFQSRIKIELSTWSLTHHRLERDGTFQNFVVFWDHLISRRLCFSKFEQCQSQRFLVSLKGCMEIYT